MRAIFVGLALALCLAACGGGLLIATPVDGGTGGGDGDAGADAATYG